ncbi:RRM3 (YHR031C) [Zygosaccharomyces parabailii]|uniref:ATP-dependent DNA helicase RRM3 n=1 Tax=Zygosaccharomyces bailii (strain CLIB 213 / ATCC 58445 / CBS 680 / BCRC 21525 / NBRC 1098 / NCYC 1416 / NRRL Y-2227) TaxID=1333698 RepID=A0A8J2T8D0_ZYGB2|nr:RRM3 (YHR031C) [Zygosaccharomyces parabailii]CDF89159.1 ZYBA0S03-10550g1_1 [Zygosaccharomyces bailii CLIB 213]CDH16247.1 related to ATP-dependent helicase RRM3 [Zygosaccharomyces bailii ISA1307]
MFRGRTQETKTKEPHGPRQKTLSSFFGPRIANTRPQHSQVSSIKPLRVCKPDLKRVRSSLTDSGSFEECDPDDEIKKLMDTPQLNNFKPSKAIRLPSGSPVTLLTPVSRNNSSLEGSPQPELRKSSPGFKLTASKRIKPIHKQASKIQQATPIALTREQEEVLNLVVNKRLNVFYTGSAGTGKSVILKSLVDRLSSLYGRDKVAVTASTGLAAATIGGTTLHKWAGIGLGVKSVDQLVKRIQGKFMLLAVWRHTRVLIIDEISMLDGRFLDKIEVIARRLRKNKKPFGGIQLVLTGDFFQLPPVGKDGCVFCFESQMWDKCVQKTILLTRVFRQKENELVNMLNCIRYGEPTPNLIKSIKRLERQVYYQDGIDPTELYATRKEVEASNARQLRKLPGKSREYHAQDVGPQELLPLLDSSVMADKVVTLKVEAQVMMLKNRPESELVNGSLGKVLFFATEKLERLMLKYYSTIDDDLILDMRLVGEAIANRATQDSAEFHNKCQARPLHRQGPLQIMIHHAVNSTLEEPVFPYVRWTVGVNKYHYELMQPESFPVDLPAEKTELERAQLPLTLCWALSIHKAQGQTIHRLKVDLRRIFEAGQVYVALSRAVSMDSLQVVNFDPNKLRANNKVKQFYQKLELVA